MSADKTLRFLRVVVLLWVTMSSIPAIAVPATFRALRTWQTESSSRLAFSPNADTLVMGGKEGHIQLWNVATGENTSSLEPQVGVIIVLRYSTDGKHIIAVFDDNKGIFSAANKTNEDEDSEAMTVASWNATSHQLEQSFRLRGDKDFDCDVSADGRLVASCANSHEYGVQLTLWDVATGKMLRAHTVSESDSYTLNFSPDGQTVIASHPFGKVMLWNTKDGTFKTIGKDAFNMTLSPDGKVFVGITEGPKEGSDVQLYDATNGRPIRTLPPYGNREPWALAFSPDSRILATGNLSNDSRVRLWNVETAQLVSTLNEHSKSAGVIALTFSPDGKLLASADMNGEVVLYLIG